MAGGERVAFIEAGVFEALGGGGGPVYRDEENMNNDGVYLFATFTCESFVRLRFFLSALTADCVCFLVCSRQGCRRSTGGSRPARSGL